MDEPVPPSKPRTKPVAASDDAAAPAAKPSRRRTPAAADATNEAVPRRRTPRAKAGSDAANLDASATPPAAPSRRRSRAKPAAGEAMPEQAPISPLAQASVVDAAITPASREESTAVRPLSVAEAAAAAPAVAADRPQRPIEKNAGSPVRDQMVPSVQPTAAPAPATPREAASGNSESAATPAPAVPTPRQHQRAAADADHAAAMIPSFARKATPATAAPVRARTAVHPADTSKRSARIFDAFIARLPTNYRERTRQYLLLMRLDRPVGALLLLWPTWWALWFAANDFPPPGALLVFTLGVFVMRSAGCVINDYADHGWLDAKVERTRERPMAAGRVSKKEALTLFAGLLAFAFVLVLFTNKLTILLSFGGAALAAIYPFTKRVTHLAQVVLGAAFGWSIPMAFAAVTDSLPPLCWLLFLANVLFSTIYDTEYAMVDRDDDIRAGAKSTAILFADADRVIIGVLMATFVFAMLLAGLRAHLHWPYYMGLAGATGLFAYQQYLIRARERMACFAAFRNNNWVGLLLWVGLVLALAIR